MKYIPPESVDNFEKLLRSDFGSVIWKLAFAPQAESVQMINKEIRVNLVANCSQRVGSCIFSLFIVFIGFMPAGNAQDQTTANSGFSQQVRNQIAPVSIYEVGKTSFQDVLDSGWRINPADGVVIGISMIEYTTNGAGVMVLGLHSASGSHADLAVFDRGFRTSYERRAKASFHYDMTTMRGREDTRVVDLSLCRLSFENWILTAKECSEGTGVVSASASNSSSDETHVPSQIGTPVLADYQDAADAHKRGDYATALKVLKPLADAGEARAQYSLGRMYQDGQGFTQNDEVAVLWYRLAAEQGHGGALNGLGFMYRNGKGVTLDYIQAHMWWDIAASQGANHAAQNLYDLKKLMTPTDISTAEALARECVAKDYKGCIPENVTIPGVLKGEISAAVQPDSAESVETSDKLNARQVSRKADVEVLLSTPPALGADYSERALILQAILKEQGKDPGPVDGLLGQKTITAANEAIDGFGSIVTDDVAGGLLQENVEATGELQTCVGAILDSEIYENILVGGFNLQLSTTGPRVALEIDGCEAASRVDIAMAPASVLGLVETEDLGRTIKKASVIDHGQRQVKIICRRVPNEDRCGVVNLKWIE